MWDLPEPEGPTTSAWFLPLCVAVSFIQNRISFATLRRVGVRLLSRFSSVLIAGGVIFCSVVIRVSVDMKTFVSDRDFSAQTSVY